MNSSKECRWEAVFSFSPPVHEIGIAVPEGFSLPDGSEFKIKFDTERKNESVIIKGFSIVTPTLPSREALYFAQKTANRIFDLMSAIHNYPIEGCLSNMVEIKPEGEVKTGIKEMTVNAILHKPEDLDFNKDSIKNVFQNKDEMLMRQLSHFRRGLETDDTITKIRDFYQICEDEYSPGHFFIEKYKYVRNIMSHPVVKQEKKLLGKKFMDPSDPKDMEVIKSDSKTIESEARKIINSKI